MATAVIPFLRDSTYVHVATIDAVIAQGTSTYFPLTGSFDSIWTRSVGMVHDTAVTSTNSMIPSTRSSVSISVVENVAVLTEDIWIYLFILFMFAIVFLVI